MSESDRTTIPEGLSCGDCRMYPKCAAFIGIKRESKECDYFPVKFAPSAVMFAAFKRDYAVMRAETDKAEGENKRLRELLDSARDELYEAGSPDLLRQIDEFLRPTGCEDNKDEPRGG